MTQTENPLLTTSETAEALHLRPITLSTWRMQGRGPKFCRLGRAIRYRAAEIQRFILAAEAGGSEVRR